MKDRWLVIALLSPTCTEQFRLPTDGINQKFAVAMHSAVQSREGYRLRTLIGTRFLTVVGATLCVMVGTFTWRTKGTSTRRTVV